MSPIYIDLDRTLTGVGDREVVARGIPHLPRDDRGQTKYHSVVDRSKLHSTLKRLIGFRPEEVIANIFGEEYEQTH